MLLDRLQNDRSLAAFAGQFVSLKIVTDNNPDWAAWSRKYPMKGNSIPQLYVVRADGQQLYGGAGSLPGDALPQMLSASINLAGRVFNSDQARFLGQAVEAASEALAKEQLLNAGVLLSQLNSLGSPADLNSYAAPAMRSKEIFNELKIALDGQVANAMSALSAEKVSDPLAHALVIFETESVFRLFQAWRNEAVTLKRAAQKLQGNQLVFEQAESIVKARLAAVSPVSRVRNRAESLYTTVIRKYEGTEAEALAREELKRLAPESKILQMADGGDEGSSDAGDLPKYRLWTAKSGNFTTNAKYLKQSNGRVQLLKSTGETVIVEIQMLSEADQTYLKKISVPGT